MEKEKYKILIEKKFLEYNWFKKYSIYMLN